MEKPNFTRYRQIYFADNDGRFKFRSPASQMKNQFLEFTKYNPTFFYSAGFILEWNHIKLEEGNVSEISEHDNIDFKVISWLFDEFMCFKNGRRIILTEKTQSFKNILEINIKLNIRKVVMKTGNVYWILK